MCLFLGIAQNFLPQGSQLDKVTQRVGVTNMTAEYSRPSVNGRALWGNLVPFLV
jgi:hypothetical protein